MPQTKARNGAYLTLPSKVFEQINQLASSETERRNLLLLAHYLYSKFIYSGSYFGDFIPISSVHFREQVSTQYKQYLTKLENAGIVEVSHFYQVGTGTEKGTCKEYRINPYYSFTSDFCLFSLDKGRHTKEKAVKGIYTADAPTRATATALKKLSLTVRKNDLQKLARQIANKQEIKYLTGTDIPFKGYKYRGKMYTLAYLQKLANKEGKELILYKDKIYIENSDIFPKRIRQQMQAVYLDSLVRIYEKDYFYKRNETNHRLDTNLTNLKSEFLQYIKVHKEKLISIDLSNSQISLLSYFIENPDRCLYILYKIPICKPEQNKDVHLSNVNLDKSFIYSSINTLGINTNTQLYGYISKQGFLKFFIFNVTKKFLKSDVFRGLNTCSSGNYSEFSKSVKTGKFYESLQDRIHQNTGQIVTRGTAKTSVFSALFSSNRSKDKTKRLLAAAYPGVIAFIDAYKRFAISELLAAGFDKQTANDKGNAALAVFLQTLESAIFIDTILTRLQKSGFWVLSKHDSIICKESDAKQVFDIVAAELNEILGAGNYTLKCEYAGTNEPFNFDL